MATLHQGDRIGPYLFQAVSGSAHAVPHPEFTTHVQFRRFTGCPNCQLHLRAFRLRQQELTAAGIQELVVFPTIPADFDDDGSGLKVVADSEGALYRAFGTTSGWGSVLHPGAWWPGLRGLLTLGMGLPPQARDYLRHPAEFIIDRAGSVLFAH